MGVFFNHLSCKQQRKHLGQKRSLCRCLGIGSSRQRSPLIRPSVCWSPSHLILKPLVLQLFSSPLSFLPPARAWAGKKGGSNFVKDVSFLLFYWLLMEEKKELEGRRLDCLGVRQDGKKEQRILNYSFSKKLTGGNWKTDFPRKSSVV